MTRVRIAAIVLASLVFDASVNGVEPWADPRLPVTEGLEIWLDVGVQTAGRKASDRPILRAGDGVDLLLDGSGRRRNLAQPQIPARPRLQKVADQPVIRFDGIDDSLQLGKLAADFSELTIFIVAIPFANPGDFRGLLAMNRVGANDYTSGINLDFGGSASDRFETFNVEGIGFGGARDLLGRSFEFGTARVVGVVSKVGADGVRFFVDGEQVGVRNRRPSTIRMDQLTLGARFYNNFGTANTRGFFEGDIAEALVFGRALPDAQRQEVEAYLLAKHARLRAAKVDRPPPALGGKWLTRVTCPPVQMLVPGFSVRRIPVELANVNNLRYRQDGKLVALAYDGNVYLLSDSNADGLEDNIERFWENNGRLRGPIGMALTPPGYPHGAGLVVASKGKCSLIVDTDGDERADKEIIIATGWQEITQNVDALGVAFDPRDGSIYFGLGTADYTNPHQVDRDGKSHYRLDSERGTILKVAPDFSKREIVCTGIRFPVALAMNRHGDLFCTDQEGATWLPNGNPFDELLYIQRGRHYGFPPRHPQHLPNVVDEPSVFDYAPQHQSTCGLVFNEPGPNQPVFGPKHWADDAFVCGYSRAKVFRTTLVKTGVGYVARNQLLACLDMLAVDACVSPRGELVIATHSGGPDWGTGPSGKGRLVRVSYDGLDLPQPLFAWSSGPHEVRVAFDRPIPPELLAGLRNQTSIEFGRYLSAGDRFEAFRPGYQVVQDQVNTPRFDLSVHDVQVTGDRRTLVIRTATQQAALSYAITLPALGREFKPSQTGILPQTPQTDLAYDLCGLEVHWESLDGRRVWTGWLPHLDLDPSRALTRSSATHDELWELLQQPGRLRLRTQLDLRKMLIPSVQPGSTIDQTPPRERVTVTTASNVEHETATWVTDSRTRKVIGRKAKNSFTVEPADDQLVGFELIIGTGSGPVQLSAWYHTADDVRPRAFPLRRFLTPWARLQTESHAAPPRRLADELAGGSWARGRRVFMSEQALCSRCHAISGQGGTIGPDLSNLVHRDYQSVLRDVIDPSYTINPDYITYAVGLKDGRVLSGVLRSAGDELIVGDDKAQTTTVHRTQVETISASGVSTMPKDVDKTLGPEGLRDLLTFLLSPPPRMADYGPGNPPPPRSRSELNALLAAAPPLPEKLRPIRLVLTAGVKDHGPGEHDYPAWQKAWTDLLSVADNVTVSTAWEWPSEDDFRSADGIVFFHAGKWRPERAAQVDPFLARGGGLVFIHYAVDGGADPVGFAQRIGLAWKGGQSRYRHGPLELRFDPNSKHPIVRNFGRVRFHDESYWRLVGDPNAVEVLATGVEDGGPVPLIWAREVGSGRIFVSIPGHYSWTFDDPAFRVLLLRGMAWSVGESVDRFNGLVPLGSRIADR